MIYFYNQADFTVNWHQAYQQLTLKFEALSKDYGSAIQLRQNLRQKIENIAKQNADLKAKKLQRQLYGLERDSQSYIPMDQRDQKSRYLRRPDSKMKPKYSESSSFKQDCLGFQCPYKTCHKLYSTPVALNLHIKKKHNGGTKKERECYARMILQAQQRGEEIPMLDITLPPNFLEEYKTSLEYCKKYM